MDRRKFNDQNSYYFCKAVRLCYLLRLLYLSVVKGKTMVLFYSMSNGLSSFIKKKKAFVNSLLLGRVLVEENPFDVTKIYDDQGRVLRDIAKIQFEQHILESFNHYLASKDLLLTHLNKKLSFLRDDLKLWMKIHLIWPFYDLSVLVEMVHWASSSPRSDLCGRDLHVILDCEGYWSHLLIKYTRAKKIQFLAFRKSKKLDSQVAVVFAYHLVNLLTKVFCFLIQPHKRPALVKNRIGTFHDGADSVNLTEFTRKRNYSLFWFPESKLDGDRIVIFSMGSASISDEEALRARSMGFNLFSCEPILRKTSKTIDRYYCSPRALRHFFEYMQELGRLLFKCKNKGDHEVWEVLAVLLFRIPFWEDFFKRNGIKVFFKPGSLLIYYDIAAKLSGAAIISFQYSYIAFMTVIHADCSDMFFVWNEYYANFYNHRHTRIRHFLQTGYIFNGVFDAVRPQAIEPRQHLRDKGARFILSVFDENLDFASYVFLRNVRQHKISFYRMILEYVQNDPTVGMIIKPKRDSSIADLKSSTQTAPIVQRLLDEKRLIVLKAQQLPAEAGLASDLAIGLIAESTAALECRLAGIPAFFYESYAAVATEGHVKNRDNFLFNDPRKLIEAIEQLRKSSEWYYNVGTPASFQCSGEGRADQRVAFFLQKLLGLLDANESKEKAIEASIQAYQERFFSQRKVTSTV